MTQLAFEVAGDDKSAAMFMKLQARVQELEAKLRAAGQAGKASGDSISKGMNDAVAQVTSLAGSYLTLQGGIQAVTQSIAAYVANMEEAATVGDKFAASVRGFAFEAGGGSRAKIQQILDTAAIHGIEKADTAIDLADTLQDMMGGDFAGAMREFAELAKLTAAGVPAGELKDIGVAALSRGKDAGQFGREMLATEAQTGLAPGTLTKFMRGIELFPDMGEGMATAAMLMQRLGDRKTQSGLTSIVEAMGEGAPKEFQNFLRKTLKLGKTATFVEKMDALAAAGMDTVEELQGAGLKEASAAQAVSIAVARRADITGLAGRVPGMATEENLVTDIARAEAENPQLKQQRINVSLRARGEFQRMMGPGALEGQLEDTERLRLGQGLRGAGVEQFGPFDTVDAQGRATTVSRVMNAVGGTPEVVEKQLRAADRFLEAADKIFDAVRIMRGGPALVPATEDR